MEKPTGFVCPIGYCTATGPTHGPYGYCNLQASARANTVNLIPIIVPFPVDIQHVSFLLFILRDLCQIPIYIKGVIGYLFSRVHKKKMHLVGLASVDFVLLSLLECLVPAFTSLTFQTSKLSHCTWFSFFEAFVC